MSGSQEQKMQETRASGRARYFQFFLLLLAAGSIYPLLYLRQNFEHTLLISFKITAEDLGNFNSLLGLIYVATYIPSGWLADRFSSRKLISFSVGGVGLLGFWYSTFPDYTIQKYIFIGWGICAGLTFWASLIKAVNFIGGQDEQGRFFGMLDGGRGLVEAILASAAVAIFAYYMGDGKNEALGTQGFQIVIIMYSCTCIAIAILAAFFLQDDACNRPEGGNDTGYSGQNIWKTTWDDLVSIFSIPQVWMMMLIIICGYMQFWATYSVSSYLQDHYKETAVVAAYITMAKLWMRPIGGIGGGFLADRLSKEKVLGASMIVASLSLFAFTYAPATIGPFFLLAMIIVIGIATYAIRGLYWSLLEDCHIRPRAVGLGIGVISMAGYAPDIFLPQLNALIVRYYPGAEGAQIYFSFIAICGLLGAVAAFSFKARKPFRKLEEAPGTV